MQRVEVRVDGENLYIDGALAFNGGSDELEREVSRLVRLGTPSLVVTPNVDHVLRLRTDPAFRAVFHQADLALVDGMPLVILARRLGARGVQRHTGADLLPRLVACSSNLGWRVVLTGGQPETSRLAACNLNVEFGGELVESVPFPILDGIEDKRSLDVIAQLRILKPSIVFLGLGSPKQELWYQHWREHLPPAVYIGAGASADFAAGVVKRAPRLVQRLSLEWLWRLAQEPSRLAYRYLVRGPAFAGVALRAIRGRSAQRVNAEGGAKPASQTDGSGEANER